MTTIAYLGPPGTFSEEAALAYGGADAGYLPLVSMPAAVTAVETGLANVCVLPIENVLEGSVTTTLDRLPSRECRTSSELRTWRPKPRLRGSRRSWLRRPPTTTKTKTMSVAMT